MFMLLIESQSDFMEFVRDPKKDVDVIILDYYTLHNMGVALVATVLDIYKLSIPVVLDCNYSLSYLLYAIEKGFKFFVYSSKHKNVLDSVNNIKDIFIFPNYESAKEYFKIVDKKYN